MTGQKLSERTIGMSELVKPDGTLNEAAIADRETLYTGMNGQRVERLYLVTGERVIFKPLTNDSQLGEGSLGIRECAAGPSLDLSSLAGLFGHFACRQ